MKGIVLVLLSLVIVGCSTREREAKIQKKISQEKAAADDKSLSNDLLKIIRASKTLSASQKKELESIIEEMKTENTALLAESFKLRSVLIKELLSGSADDSEVKQLNKDIKKVESKRLEKTLDSISKISLIIANDPEGQVYSEHLISIGIPLVR